jgi:molybdopterin-containing oxidoreductase family iron-sulfur binding subunit
MVAWLGGMAIGVAAVAATPMRTHPMVIIAMLAGCGVVWGVFAAVRLYSDRGVREQVQVVTAGAALAKTDAPTGGGVPDSWGAQRRSFLKACGVGTLGAIPVMMLPSSAERLIREIVAPGSHNGVKAALSKGPATGPSGRIRQWSMIVDLRSCDGCQSQGTAPKCTVACIEGHFAPEPMQWIEVYEGSLEGGGTQFIPTPCQQCQNPPCVNVCPVGATFSTPEGTVLIDQNRCIGCRICMAACPYDRRFFNWGNPPIPPESMLADYSPEHQAPAQRGTVMKCDFCPDMVRAGTLPFCALACPNNAIYYGDLEEDIATNGVAIVKASRFLSENAAYRIKEHLGTAPRVYYIPGHGERVGRDPYTTGREPTVWPWVERAEGSVTWNR